MILKQPAGFGIRLLASFVDFFIFSIISGLVVYSITGNYATERTNEFPFQLFYLLYLTIIPVLWGGYIIGKRICKIKVKRVKDDGKVTLLNMMMRQIVGYYIVAIATLGISLFVSVLMIIFRDDKRSIHDFIGGTYVSKE